MSLIARQRWDGRIILFCKGADTVMLARVRDGQAIQRPIEAHLVRRRGGCRSPQAAACPARADCGAFCAGAAWSGAPQAPHALRSRRTRCRALGCARW